MLAAPDVPFTPTTSNSSKMKFDLCVSGCNEHSVDVEDAALIRCTLLSIGDPHFFPLHVDRLSKNATIFATVPLKITNKHVRPSVITTIWPFVGQEC